MDYDKHNLNSRRREREKNKEMIKSEKCHRWLEAIVLDI